jgi:hypothetical protein
MDNVERGRRPVAEYCTFKEAQTILGKKHRGSIENYLKNGALRFYPVSPLHGKARMIYRDDVTLLQLKQRDKEKTNDA